MATLAPSVRQQILQFEIDDPGVTLTFAWRLARENGWNLSYTERVIREYKRFLVLAMEAGHVVTPSEQVDQAWHLHLTYTRSYWEKLCREILGRPLHHGPTQGGDEEQAKYKHLYAQTLASYERLFGEPPPADIWSPVDVRFDEDLQHVTVNTTRYWIIPKPRWPDFRLKSVPAPLLAVALLGLPLLGFVNPYDLKGPPFLLLLAITSTIAFFVALFARQLLWPAAPEELDGKPLDSYEVACLAAGRHRAIDAAVASLVQAGHLELAEQQHGWLFKRKMTVMQPGKPLPRTAPQLERAIVEAAQPFVINALQLRPKAEAATREVEQSLIRRGLVYQTGRTSAAQIVAGAIMLSPLLLAVPKLFLGIARDKPVGFLLVACVLIPVVAAGVMLFRKYRTPAGDHLLAQYVEKFEPNRVQAKADITALQPAELSMAVGLFGATLLTGGQLDPLQRIMSHASGGGGCGTGSSGGCGSGCGGGGCGGGGCGGCGGS